jgi:hypothetical protein
MSKTCSAFEELSDLFGTPTWKKRQKKYVEQFKYDVDLEYLGQFIEFRYLCY